MEGVQEPHPTREGLGEIHRHVLGPELEVLAAVRREPDRETVGLAHRPAFRVAGHDAAARGLAERLSASPDGRVPNGLCDETGHVDGVDVVGILVRLDERPHAPQRRGLPR
jgi:hypothetical protein